MDAPYASTRTLTTSNRSPATAAVDNLIRRALKISNPNDADEVAKALLARYPDDAAKIRREQMGLPATVYTPQPVAPVQTGRPEVTLASDGLEAALTQLTTDPDLADIAPEMRGWATAIRRAAADGVSSSMFAIDAGERDRAFGARRTLGDFARLARYIAAINSCATEIYCRLARACDLVANIILVLVGDALANGGVTQSGAVIQVPAAALQMRRDAVIVALRNLLQLTPTGDQETLPRGAEAVQQIYDRLQRAGAPDLRALLDEAYLAQQLDDLIDLAAGSSPDGLRALGATAAITVQRLQRFLQLAGQQITPESPPATTFFVELQLFIDGFAGGKAGYRLPYLARSPLLVSGLLTSATLDVPTQQLLSIALQRTALADQVDCLCCCCDIKDAQELVLAGKVLSDLDRAIDLLSLGDGGGDAEIRAAAYGVTIEQARVVAAGLPASVLTARTIDAIIAALAYQGPNISSINVEIVLDGQTITVLLADLILFENIALQIGDEYRWGELVSSIAPSCNQSFLFTRQRR